MELLVCRCRALIKLQKSTLYARINYSSGPRES